MKTFFVLFLTVTGLSCGYSSKKQMNMTQPGIVPVIAQLNPSGQIHGGSDFTLEVDGSNFNANAVVNWNGAPRSNKEAPTANKLHVIIPASDIATAGTAQVTVVNPGSTTPGGPYGGGSNTPSETSKSVTFTIT